MELIIGPMFSGKSTELIRRCKRLRSIGLTVLVINHALDQRDGSDVVTHDGQRLKAMSCSSIDLNLLKGFDVIAIDEAQFLTPEQVDQALAIAVLDEIPVVAFGIRTDFRTKAFPGSQRLMEVAHSLQEMKTICRCGNKAVFNARLGEHGIIREGEQVMIDGEAARYEALCARCYLEADGA